MTEPTDESEPTLPSAPTPAPAPVSDATADIPPPEPQAPVPPLSAAVFAPVARPPRTPWVNPVRRWHVVAAAVVIALVFAGGGIAVGNSFDNGHGDQSRNVRVERNYLPPDGRGEFVRPGGGNRVGPGPVNPPVAPSTSPSKTS